MNYNARSQKKKNPSGEFEVLTGQKKQKLFYFYKESNS